MALSNDCPRLVAIIGERAQLVTRLEDQGKDSIRR